MILMISFFGCEYQDMIGITAEQKIGRIENYDFENDIPKFKDEYEATNWIYDNSKYVSDQNLYNQREYLDTPEEFYNNKNNNKMQGDCDGYSGILMYILSNQFNYNVELTKIQLIKNNIHSFHAIVYINDIDIFIDPLNCRIYYGEKDLIDQNLLDYDYIKIKHLFPYEEYLWIAVNFHQYIN
jgi:hypothetical protein